MVGKSKMRRPTVAEADLVLTFREAVRAFQSLAPKRMRTLEVLRATGAQTMYALAKRLKRNYSNVHTDIKVLSGFGLVEKDAEGRVLVPWDSVEIRFPIGVKRKGQKR